MRIFTDQDLEDPPLGEMRQAIAATITADARAEAVAPPRHVVDFGTGGLVFTIGGPSDLAGFRVYQTFAKPGNPADTQIVAVWSRQSAELLGVAIGNRLGALRTGCIGGVAVHTMASRHAVSLAVVGTGRQAEAQLLGVSGTRRFEDIRIWGRNRDAAADLAARAARWFTATPRAVPTAREAVGDADVVILATSATAAVIEADWVASHAHVTTLGPKSRDGHELPFALAEKATLIATDSPQQIARMGAAHMLAGTPEAARTRHLGDLIGTFDPDFDRGLTLFLSTGLAGTEAAALAAIAEKAP